MSENPPKGVRFEQHLTGSKKHYFVYLERKYSYFLTLKGSEVVNLFIKS